jgi:hypothetical protein
MTRQFEDYLANSLSRGYQNHRLSCREHNGRIECEVGPEGQKPELAFTAFGCVVRIQPEDQQDE